MAKEESAVEPPSEAPAAPVDVVQPHSMSIPEVLAYFGANPKAGLSSSDVDARYALMWVPKLLQREAC
eukprot:scaffold7439_cov286-Pinguiococcus_pyrenoidosus.AAC.2